MNENEKVSENPIKRLFRVLGPGLITGASDDDPSGIATYSQAGAAFGHRLLWTSVLTFPLMAAIQEMCARIGMVTQHGLSGVVKRYYPKWILYVVILFSFPAITLNIGADLAGMGAVANMLFPTISPHTFSISFTLLLMVFVIFVPYRKMAAVLKWLCLSLLCYCVVPFISKQDWVEIIYNTIIPSMSWDKAYLAAFVGILGTTISPYLFFWQASVEVEETLEKKIIVDKQTLSEMRLDVRFGILFSNIVFYFIIMTTGTVLFPAGIHEITTVDQAAEALRPLAGESAYLLFAVGVIGTGMLAIPVLAGSLSYILADTFDWEEGMNKKFFEAKKFYSVIIISLLVALSIDYMGISPVRALIITAILYGVTAPFLIGIILHISNNKKIMRDEINSRSSNILGFITLVVMTVAAILLLITSI